jgi:lysozyme family protein
MATTVTNLDQIIVTAESPGVGTFIPPFWWLNDQGTWVGNGSSGLPPGGGGNGGGGNPHPDPCETANPPAYCNETKPCESFDTLVKKVLDVEKGFKNDSTDPGDPTNHGISWPTWQDYAEKVLGEKPTLQNLKDLTKSQASQIYKEEFWEPISADKIEDGDLRYLLFDFYITSKHTAIHVLQKTLNDLGANIREGYYMNKETLNAINNFNNQTKLYNTFKEKRKNYYQRIANESATRYLKKDSTATEEEIENNTLKKYLDGWNNRVDSFSNKTKSDSTNVNCKN